MLVPDMKVKEAVGLFKDNGNTLVSVVDEQALLFAACLVMCNGDFPCSQTLLPPLPHTNRDGRVRNASM